MPWAIPRAATKAENWRCVCDVEGQPLSQTLQTGNAAEHASHSADVVRVRVGGDEEVYLLHSVASQALHDAWPGDFLARVHKHVLTVREVYEDAIALAYVDGRNRQTPRAVAPSGSTDRDGEQQCYREAQSEGGAIHDGFTLEEVPRRR